MRFLRVCLMLIFSAGIIFTSVPGLYADETSEIILKLLVKKGIITQEDVDEIKSQVVKEKSLVPQGIEERVTLLEEKSEETGFLSAKGYKIDVKGGAEIEFVNIQDDDAGVALDTTSSPDDSENPRLQVDKVTMRFTVTGEDETVGFSTELEMDEGDNAFFDDAYIFVKDLEWLQAVHSFTVGLQNRFIVPKQIFESYPLNGFAWYEDEEYMALYKGEHDDWLYWYGELARANEINDKAPTENGQFEMIHDNRRTSNSAEIGNKFAAGGGLGFKLKLKDLGKVNILGFGRSGTLTDDDVSFMQGLTGYSSSETSTDYLRTGVNLDYKHKNCGLRGQFMYAEDGTLDRKGWYIEPYYNIHVGWRYLDSITPAVQLSWLDVDLANTTADARTWDREKYTLGAVFKINKNLQWKNEYSINEEDTGGAEVDNNEFISQLKFSF